MPEAVNGAGSASESGKNTGGASPDTIQESDPFSPLQTPLLTLPHHVRLLNSFDQVKETLQDPRWNGAVVPSSLPPFSTLPREVRSFLGDTFHNFERRDRPVSALEHTMRHYLEHRNFPAEFTHIRELILGEMTSAGEVVTAISGSNFATSRFMSNPRRAPGLHVDEQEVVATCAFTKLGSALIEDENIISVGYRGGLEVTEGTVATPLPSLHWLFMVGSKESASESARADTHPKLPRFGLGHKNPYGSDPVPREPDSAETFETFRLLYTVYSHESQLLQDDQ